MTSTRPASLAKPYSSYFVATTTEVSLKSRGGAKVMTSPWTEATVISAPPTRYCVPASAFVNPSASPYVDGGNRTLSPSPRSMRAKPKSSEPKLIETPPTKPGADSTCRMGVASKPTSFMVSVQP